MPTLVQKMVNGNHRSEREKAAWNQKNWRSIICGFHLKDCDYLVEPELGYTDCDMTLHFVSLQAAPAAIPRLECAKWGSVHYWAYITPCNYQYDRTINHQFAHRTCRMYNTFQCAKLRKSTREVCRYSINPEKWTQRRMILAHCTSRILVFLFSLNCSGIQDLLYWKSSCYK